jgi:transcriptional regulator NrdR family protein
MKCPRCDAPLRTLDTREENGGTVRRRRKCTAGHIFMTVERITEDRTPTPPLRRTTIFAPETQHA